MTSHELAKRLLAGPDLPVAMEDNGYDMDDCPEVRYIEQDMLVPNPPRERRGYSNARGEKVSVVVLRYSSIPPQETVPT